MSAPNPNWARWTYSSFAQYFTTAIAPFPLFIEGQDRRTNDKTDYAELRIDGPFMKECSKGYWELVIEISILVVGYINETDLWKQSRNCGLVSSTFQAVSMKNFGNADPPMDIGCYEIFTDGRDRILISNFGQINADSQMLQSTVDAKYRMTLQI